MRKRYPFPKIVDANGQRMYPLLRFMNTLWRLKLT